MVRRLLALAALGAALAVSACALFVEDPAGASLEERARSLQGHEAVAIAGEPLAGFGTRRTLVVGAVEVVGWNEYRAHGGFGSAAAVTTDGYVLTAAHCLGGRPVPPTVINMSYPLRPVPSAQARVVWSGWKAGRAGPDLALVHVDARALRVEAAFGLTGFDVAALATRVYSVGYGDPPRLRVATGEVLETRRHEPVRPGEPAVLEVWTRVPLRQGDSGGPTFDGAGRLVGITSQGRWTFFDGWSTLTLLPDATWLQERIEADRRAQAAR